MPPLAAVTPLPADLAMRADRLAIKLQPAVRAWVAQQGRAMAQAPTADVARIRGAVAQRFRGQINPQGGDIETLVMLVLMECVRQEQADLRDMLAAMQASRQKRAALRGAGQTVRDAASGRSGLVRAPGAAVRSSFAGSRDSMSEMGEAESLRLQMAMDRHSKFMSTLSNLLKKMSETSSGIVQNLK